MVSALLAPSTGAIAAPHLAPVGTFVEPIYATAPHGDERRLFVVEFASEPS